MSVDLYIRSGFSHNVGGAAGKPHRNWTLFIPIATEIVCRANASLLNEKTNSVGRIIAPRLRQSLKPEMLGMHGCAKQWYGQMEDLIGVMNLDGWAAKIRVGMSEHEELDKIPGALPGDDVAAACAADEL